MQITCSVWYCREADDPGGNRLMEAIIGTVRLAPQNSPDVMAAWFRNRWFFSGTSLADVLLSQREAASPDCRSQTIGATSATTLHV